MYNREYGSWLNWSYGKKLKKLHAWNAITITLLAVSGVLLFLPPVRRLGAGRIVIRDVHIGLGLLLILLLLFYLPLLTRHWQQLKNKWNQRGNLVAVLLLLLGWIVSGLIIWKFKWFTGGWTEAALTVHDVLTWVGVPYAAYHSLVRSRWVRQYQRRLHKETPVPKPLVNPETVTQQFLSESEMSSSPSEYNASAIPRRTFIKWSAGLAIAAVMAPFFLRWLTSGSNGTVDLANGSDASRGNHMEPLPVPLPDSDPPKGGGAKGRFRIYTVTAFPRFDSKNWSFDITGLVEQPLHFTWEQFLKRKRSVQVSNFHCVTGWTVNSITWEGVPLTQLLDEAKASDRAAYVKFYSGDGVYTDTLTLKQARMQDVMVAMLIDGKLIPQQQGGPVRLVVPEMYGYKSVKWLEKVELIDKPHTGYWEARGYSTNAWVNGHPPL